MKYISILLLSILSLTGLAQTNPTVRTIQFVNPAGFDSTLITTDGIMWYNHTTDKFRFRQNGVTVSLGSGSGGGGTWGSITGTLSNQTDLQNALNAKQNTITFGTGVQTALGVNIGSAGAPVLFNGAGGAPTSLTIPSNATATTQSTGDNDTSPATTAFVQQEIDARSEERTYKFTDDITPITATTGKLSFYWPFDNTTITSVWVGLATVQTSGSTFTVDVNKNSTTILSTKITVDNTENTSLTAAAPPVLSVTTLAKGDKVTIDVDQQGDNTAKGAELHIEYTRP